MSKSVQQLDRVVIRIAGDSGDGMQLTGDRFTQETASFGNDLFTFPAFPAEFPRVLSAIMAMERNCEDGAGFVAWVRRT